jgi:16S rRNA (cytosine967-C5)-methyltransferase
MYRYPEKLNILQSQLKAASEIWNDIQNDPSPADRWLGNYFHHYRKRFGARDRKFISETIYACFRHKIFLDEWRKEVGLEENPLHLVLLAAAAEMMITPEQFVKAVAELNLNIPNIYERLSKKSLPHTMLFKSKHDQFVKRYSFPLWLIERWTARLGLEETQNLLESLQKRPPLTIRINPIKTTREKLVEAFKAKNWIATETLQSPYGLTFSERISVFDSDEFRDGLFEIQDEGSQLVCLAIDAKPGENVWDVCAGGGGKSLLMAAMMQNKGRIVATDIRARKLDELKKRAQRAGIYNIFAADLDRMDQSREAKKGFDKILVDAPCSGTGTLRRNPDAKWKLQEDRFSVFHRDQIAILENALPSLKKGGRLYYVTCSLEPEENELVIQELLDKHVELELIRPTQAEPGENYFRLLPHKGTTDGFFLAIMTKK